MRAMLTLLPFAMAFAQPQTVEGTPTPIRPLLTINGPHSKLTKAEIRVVTNQKDWEEFWRRHMGVAKIALEGRLAPPMVDFKKHEVVAVVQAPGWNSHGVEFVSIENVQDVIRVRFNDLSYQTFGSGQRCTAFGFAVVPHMAGKYRFEDNVQGLIGKPPIWKHVATIEVK